MPNETIKPFLCDNIDKNLLRVEWEKWLRSFQIYAQSEEIIDVVKKRNKLLHLGGPQLQEVIYNIPGALAEYDKDKNNDVFQVLVDKLGEHFSPKRNSTFERHLFRALGPIEGEDFNKFLLRLRTHASKCSFGETKKEIEENCLKDKIIDTWAPKELKRKLLEKEQSLDEIIDACRVFEQINKQTESIIAKQDQGLVNTIRTKRNWDTVEDEECGRCGRKGHKGTQSICPAKVAQCAKCSLIGHFARKCKTKSLKRRPEEERRSSQPFKRRRGGPSGVRLITEDAECEPDDNLGEFNCFKINDSEPSDKIITCRIGGCDIEMIIDSGSRHNLLSESDWQTLKINKAVCWDIRSQSPNQFKGYAADKALEVLCVFEFVITIRTKPELIASFFVIKNGTQSLLGRETATRLGVLRLGLNINSIDTVAPFPKINGIKIRLSINEQIKPVQQPLRRVPMALEAKVSAKLDEAVAQDIIEPVRAPSPWISPVAIAFKADGDLRICIDMRRANKAIQRENFPLPTFDAFMTKLKGAKVFSRLDLKSAYHQLELHEDSRGITTFITHKGLFRYKRLMFGVNSAPEIFQRTLEELLAGCSNTLNYLDDIIVFGSSETEHDRALKQVLEVCKNKNITLNEDKCLWKKTSLKFLGHILSGEGILPDPDKIKTISELRAPTTKEEVRSFLGLVTYVGKFIPDLADTTQALRDLLKNNTKFSWGHRQETAFARLKEGLKRIPKLSYFDPKNRTQLIADASPVALGAVLLQFKGDDPQIISFASKSLSEIEKRYSQTEKESLTLVWAVERFYYYLAGLEFELVTDHKPLEAIFKPTSKPPARIERWLLRLQAFKFTVKYRAGKENIADSISRLCKLENVSSFDDECEVNISHIVENSIPRPMSISEIANKSAEDEEIAAAVLNTANDSWDPTNKSAYYPFRHEFAAVGNILLRGNRIIIPKTLRKRILELAHEGHPGETAMKRRVRARVWWPRIDKDVEEAVKNCRDCLLVSQPANPAPMGRHPFPRGPWQCVAADLLGPLPSQEHLLVVIDYYSRYQEAVFLRSITAGSIINSLEEIFSRLGIPRSIKTDNGRQFVGVDFKKFCERNGIEHMTSPPYWPQANGEVENMNRSLVKRLKIAHTNRRNYKEEIQQFTLMYNTTPHGTTGVAPTELMFNRVIRDKLPTVEDLTEDMIDSEARDRDTINKQKGKERGDKDRGAKQPDIRVQDRVLVRNLVPAHKLASTFDPTEYVVISRDGNEATIQGAGRTLRRNICHLKKIPTRNIEPMTPTDEDPIPTVATPATGRNMPASTAAQPHPIEPETPCPEPSPRVVVKLKNTGGMWQPVPAEPDDNDAGTGHEEPPDSDAE